MAKIARPDTGQVKNRARGGFQSAGQAVDAVAEVRQKLAGGTQPDLTKLNQSLAQLLNQLTRHNIQLFQRLAQPTNWGKAARLQHQFLRTSWQRAAQLGRRYVDVSQAAMTTRSRERPVEETVTLRDEAVEVAHRPTDRKLMPENAQGALQCNRVEMLGISEEPETRNDAWVVSEVVSGKQVEEHKDTVQDTARRSEVEAEEIKPHIHKSSGRAMMAVRAFIARSSRSTPRWSRIGTVLGAAAAALAVAALYNRYHTRQIERRHP